MAGKRFIFRWKDQDGLPGCEVIPSERDTPEEVREFAEQWLRAASETPAEGKRSVRRLGEVIEVKT